MAPEGGRPAGSWTAAELGVHPVIGGGPMTAYIRRPHDKLLRAMLDPDVPESRLVVVRGDPATGKTRAVYEAVVDQLADWSLEYPPTVAALAARLEAGIPDRTVLWLGELRHYADADGGAVALSRLDDLLEDEGRLVVTTIWPEHWDLYVAVARGGTGAGDPAGVAGRLLDHLEELAQYGPDVNAAYGGVLDVPDRFTVEEMTAAAAAGDPVLAAAAAHAAGQVTQYLAGVPELLRRYDGPGGDPGGQAIITAAMDAARLGHAAPLPAALLQDAAAGYLTGPPRTEDGAGWALAWATAEVTGAVPALRPVQGAAASGEYRVSGYLEQYGRRARADRLGPVSLWDALAARVNGAGDLGRLAQAAWDRGLYRYAAALGTTAASLGSTDAARQLVTHLCEVSPAEAGRAARWAVGIVRLDDPWEVAGLLEALHAAGAGDAIRALLARRPGEQVRLVWWDLGRLLAALHQAALHTGGASEAVGVLAGRAAGEVGLDDVPYVAWLLREMHAAGAVDALGVLAGRAAAEVGLDDISDVAALLRALHAVGAVDALGVLAGRAADEADIEDPQDVAWLLKALLAAGGQDAVATLLARDPAAHADADQAWESAELVAALHLVALSAAGEGEAVRVFAARAAEQAEGYPESMARLLTELRAAGADDAVRALLARDLAGEADLDFADDLGSLLVALHEAGAGDAVQALGARAAEEASPYDSSGVAPPLLAALHAVGAAEAVRVLAARAVDDVSLDGWDDVAGLLEVLYAVGAFDAVRALAARAAAEASLDDPWNVASLLGAMSAAGAVDALRVLAGRAAGQASLDDAAGVARLLESLRAGGAFDAVRALAGRAAEEASLDDAQGVARLLEELRAAGADEAVAALLARDPAGQVAVGSDRPFRSTRRRHVARLLAALRAAGAFDAARVLAVRAADAGLFALFLEAYPGEAFDYRFGREPDGSPSPSWTWRPPGGSA
jgi:hypothetical protein